MRVYWRRGCPFCSSLRRGLRRAGVATEEVDIWSDPDAAATLRRVTGGSETVPTVEVGGAFLVNPSTRAVLAALARHGSAEADPPSRDGQPGRPRRRLRWRSTRD